MTVDRAPLIVVTEARAYEFKNCTYSLDDEGYLHIERLSGPNGKGLRTEVALFSEWITTFWTDGIEAIERMDGEEECQDRD